jgi:hypothetical protein
VGGAIPHGIDVAILAAASLIVMRLSLIDPASRLPGR